MANSQDLPQQRPTAAFIGAQERAALLDISMAAAAAAGDIITLQSRRYAECAVRLLKAAIGEPLTLGEAQSLLERWTLLGTPLEERFTRAIRAIKTRREVLGDETSGEEAS